MRKDTTENRPQEILCFQCRGHGFHLWLGNYDPHMPHGAVLKKKDNRPQDARRLYLLFPRNFQ